MTEPTAPTPHPRTYLGDGVYAWHEGTYVWIETDRGTYDPVTETTTPDIHTIAVDVPTFFALVRYCLGSWDDVSDAVKRLVLSAEAVKTERASDDDE